LSVPSFDMVLADSTDPRSPFQRMVGAELGWRFCLRHQPHKRLEQEDQRKRDEHHGGVVVDVGESRPFCCHADGCQEETDEEGCAHGPPAHEPDGKNEQGGLQHYAVVVHALSAEFTHERIAQSQRNDQRPRVAGFGGQQQDHADGKTAPGEG